MKYILLKYILFLEVEAKTKGYCICLAKTLILSCALFCAARRETLPIILTGLSYINCKIYPDFGDVKM